MEGVGGGKLKIGGGGQKIGDILIQLLRDVMGSFHCFLNGGPPVVAGNLSHRQPLVLEENEKNV